MLSATFIARGVDTLRDPTGAAETARSTLSMLSVLPGPVGARVPTNATTVARVNAAVQVAGGLLLAAGRAPRLTAAALAVTTIPGSLGSQAFLKESDPQRAAAQRRELLTDVSLLGGLIIAAADTAGKPSLAWRGRRAARQVSASVAAAVPGVTAGGDGLTDSAIAEKIGHGLAVGAERGRELADAAVVRATELASELAHAAREHGPEVADAARERATEFAHVARERAPELAEAARERSAALADLARTQLDHRRDR
ncbi:DoxX family protein [Mycobacterium sp. CBMA247]|nr:DoxX family protein [Mycolicibacterium sp. CBMA 329]MUL88455.1 DoxX family protein [Mycolicibacterium sp. CBMA 331]MUM00206.1 DoxX family protein [Mycolicibacterium sp. CBMA 334]MUM27867.1 DoxX family protein [Mycolicibacterium sp. CBMA 295]MUM40102.1 DoxX family protein [Mycolicibacterium sp. CBMA 247]MUM44520.1 DoxX family protein [Mycolicibacterium sp. CBMA 294]